MKRYAIALSHLPNNCSGNDLPVRKVLESVEYIKKNNGILVTSMGELNWDLQLFAAHESQIPVELIFANDSATVKDVQFEIGDISIISSETVGDRQVRDREVLKRSDVVLPVWCRRNGRMDTILTSLQNEIDTRFDVSLYHFSTKVKYEIDTVSNEIKDLPDDYLWHWTRQTNHPWIDDTIATFCHDLIYGETYPRSALMTLQKIVKTKTLLASGELIYQNTPVVSFTENHPMHMKDHFSWRVGRHEMNFEPYGIGFPKEVLRERGVVPVEYNGEPSWMSISSGDKWKTEREWRHKGNLMFDDELLKEMIVIVRKANEMSLFPLIEVVAYEKNGKPL